MVDGLCFEDLDLGGQEIDDPLAELEQDIFHRLIERPGENIDDPDRGVGLLDALSGPIDNDLARRIEADLHKDSRISAVRAVISAIEGGVGQYRIQVFVVVDEQELAIELESDGAGGVRRVTK